MIGKVSMIVAGLAIGAAEAPVLAQTTVEPQEQVRAAARTLNEARRGVDQIRYQIVTMERVLENAVEHGAAVWRDRIQAVVPGQTLLLDSARVRGYRLDDYGIFFDVEVPSISLETTLFSAFRTLDQNGLGLRNALNQVKAFIQASGDASVEQALKRIELQIAPLTASAAAIGSLPAPRTTVSGSPAVPPAAGAPAEATDPILNDPEDAYRTEVKDALIDAMLDHSAALGIRPGEWLTIGAPTRRSEVRPRLGPSDNRGGTIIIRARGSDLAAFRSGQISREETVKRVDVRVF